MIDVSVIIPTINRPDLLRRALLSVVQQRGGILIESIVADDGDPSQAGRVREVTEQGKGVYLSTGGYRGGGYARNLGIEQAKGNLIAFLDDDDAWAEDKILRQSALMVDQSVAMSYTGMFITDRKGRRRYSFRKPRFEDHYRSIVRNNFIGTTSTVMVRRSALREIGGFDPDLTALQDYDLYIRLLRRFRTGWIDAPLTIYYDDDATGDKVSGSRERFLAARRLLSEKYRGDEQFALLRKSLRSIVLLKCLRSRRFLIDTLRAFIQGH